MVRPPGVVALVPPVLEIQRRAKQAHYPAPVFSGAGICDLEDFFIGSRKACAWLVPFYFSWLIVLVCPLLTHVFIGFTCIHRGAGIKATPKPTAFPVVMVQQPFPITSLSRHAHASRSPANSCLEPLSYFQFGCLLLLFPPIV